MESGWSWGIAAIAAVGLLAAAVIALPIPSIGWQRNHPVEDLEYEVGAQLGWREMAEVVAREVDALPADEAAGVAIYAQNYGEAGAIDLYGPDLGLPRAASPHNSYWWWGPPRDAPVTIVIGVPDAWLDDLRFASCERVHTFDAPRGVLSEETGRSVQVCRDRRVPWADLWDDLQFIRA